MRKILSYRSGGFVKFKVAYVPRDETYIVFSKSHIIETDLSEGAAITLAQFLNCQEYLNTDPKERVKHAATKYEFDFESIYSKYPRHIGKKTGLETLKKKVLTPEKFQLLQLALENYISITHGQDEKYILHFSTWANRFEDYIPEDICKASNATEQLSLDDISKLMSN